VVGRILQADGRGKTVIFCRTKRQAAKLSDELIDRGFNASALHGDMSQEAREKSMIAFRTGKKDILVATEVAARGIDVDDVTHVINYSVPEDEKAYLHRVGRTGRAGRLGTAVTFVDWEDLARWTHIDKELSFGQPDPMETYSSSEHLFADLSIPAGTKGRIRASTRVEGAKPTGDRGARPGQKRSAPRSGSARPKSDSKDNKQASRSETKSEPRPPRSSKTRNRTRGGQS
jgi:superfamily II DNA/RNA helicase